MAGSLNSAPISAVISGVRSWPQSVGDRERLICSQLLSLTHAAWVGCMLEPGHTQGVPQACPPGWEAVVAELQTNASGGSSRDFESVRQQEGQSQVMLWVPVAADGLAAREPLGWIALLLDRPEEGKGAGVSTFAFAESALLMMSLHLGHLFLEQKFRQDLQVRDQFLSIASHELKTPLTSIYGILQLQERMMKSLVWPGELRADQDRHLSFLRLVIRQTERMTELIDGLLDVSRIQVGRFSVEPMVSEVGKVVQEVVGGRLDLLAREAGVQILLDIPTEISAWVDLTRFEEVVSNLTMNALRMSPEGGVVWVRIRKEGGDVVLSVRDQGQVIPAEDRERVFEPFERARAVARMGGLGLGLYISRQIARRHGGDLLLLPTGVARGNVFEARFPGQKP